MGMQCEDNRFCRLLTPAARDALCASCAIRNVRKGSQKSYDDEVRSVKILLEGAILEEGSEAGSEYADVFLMLPGHVSGFEETFFYEAGVKNRPSHITFLTDCRIASFNHSVVRKLFNNDKGFRQAIINALFQSVQDSTRFASILRNNYIYESVRRLVRLLIYYNVHLTQQQIGNILCHDRTSIATAMGKLEQAEPELMLAY
jgi:CRP-like cAMP-binding protein